jgi:hypothetical protein
MGKISTRLNGRSFFFTAFSVISFWRIACLWRENIDHFHQDEIVWDRDSSSSSLFQYIRILDSGYPTPLLRAILWVASRVLNGNPTYIHLLSVFIVALCCTSLLFLRGYNKKNLAVAAVSLGCFPSFDLLLWHNLSYFGFIPLMVVFLNGFSLSRNGYWSIFGMQILILFSCKPQLLAVDLALFFLLATRHFRQNNSLALLNVASSILPLSLLIVGRQNSSSLPLQVGIKELIIALAALAIVPIAITLPAIFVGLSGFLRMYSQSELISLLQITLVAAQSLFFFSTKERIKSFIGSERRQIILVSAFPLYLSLFIFGNSTWGNDLFWRIPCTECLLQRHIFPLTLLATLAILEMRNNLFKKFLLFGLLGQFLALGFLAYSVLLGLQ